MEWMREKLNELKDDRRDAYCFYIGVLEQCIRSRDMERADEAMQIAEEVFGWIVK